MRWVDRSSVEMPAILNPDGDAFQKELSVNKSKVIKAKVKKDGTLRANTKFTLYKHATVKAALDKLFHGKCAYCESMISATQPMDVEHFYPKKHQENGEFPFLELAARWENLLPSCIDCNRRRNQNIADIVAYLATDEVSEVTTAAGKESQFHTVSYQHNGDDVELPALLDPCCELRDPGEYLTHLFDIDEKYGVLVMPKAPPNDTDEKYQTAVATISTLALNRLGLRQARLRRLVEVQLVLQVLREDDAAYERLQEIDVPVDEALADVFSKIKSGVQNKAALLEGHLSRLCCKTAPYSLMVRDYLDQKGYFKRAGQGPDSPPSPVGGRSFHITFGSKGSEK